SSPPSCSSHPLCAHLHLHSFPTRRSSDLDLHIAEILRPTAPLTALLLPRACGVGTCPWASDRPCTGRTITWERNHRRAFGNHGRLLVRGRRAALLERAVKSRRDDCDADPTLH